MVFVAVEVDPGIGGTPNTVVVVLAPLGPSPGENELGDMPTPVASQVTTVVVDTPMGPDPVPVPSRVRTDAPFFRTGTSTLPEVVRFAAVEKVCVPGSSSERNECTLDDVSAAIAGLTVVAACTTVHAISKVGFLEESVGVFRRADATTIRDPVPVTLVAPIMATEMKRVPDEEAGIKFSLGGPFGGIILLLVFLLLLFEFFLCDERELVLTSFLRHVGLYLTLLILFIVNLFHLINFFTLGL